MNKIEQLANLKQGFTKGFITEKEYKKMEQKLMEQRNN